MLICSTRHELSAHIQILQKFHPQPFFSLKNLKKITPQGSCLYPLSTLETIFTGSTYRNLIKQDASMFYSKRIFRWYQNLLQSPPASLFFLQKTNFKAILHIFSKTLPKILKNQTHPKTEKTVWISSISLFVFEKFQKNRKIRYFWPEIPIFENLTCHNSHENYHIVIKLGSFCSESPKFSKTPSYFTIVQKLRV